MTRIENRIDKLSNAKRKLLEARLRGGGTASPSAPERFAASLAQRRLWFIDQLLGPSHIYNNAHGIRFRGPLDAGILRRALAGIVRRHQSLRMRFESGEDGPVSIAGPAFEPEMPFVDLRHLAADEHAAEQRRHALTLGQESFDLSAGPLFRAKLLQLADDEHFLILIVHHIVSDRWSVGVLLRELAAFYDAQRDAKPVDLPPLGIAYAQFAQSQLAQSQSAAMAPHRDYWIDAMRDLPQPFELPTDQPRPAIGSHAGATHTWRLSRDLKSAIEQLGRSRGATPFMVAQAAFHVLLHRYTGREDIVIGTPLAGRSRLESEALIGLFVNLLPVRLTVNPSERFVDLLERAKTRSLELLSHQQMPFEQLVEELKVPRELSRSPLFDIAFNFHNVPFTPSAPEGMSVELEEIDLGVSRFDLTLLMRPDGAGGMNCAIEYRSDLFDPAAIQRMAGHFITLLHGIVANPEQTVARLPMLTAFERRQILEDWSGAGSCSTDPQVEPGNAPAAGFHELFERQALKTPNAVALVHGRERWTYAELNGRANQLAWHLRELGVGPETLIGICLSRSPRLVVAILAVWKAGGAYVPLDPVYPRQRLAAMLDDTHAPYMLVERETVSAIGARPGHHVIQLDELENTIARLPRRNPEPLATPTNLAYVIYTSGSTGQPKGVAIEHRGAITLVAWMRETFADEHVRGGLFAASISFDMSVFELLIPLIRGGKAILVNNVLELADAPVANEVTFMICAPSAMTEILRAGRLPASLRAIALGAEMVSATLVRQCYSLPGIERVYDLYGPTEDSIVSTGCIALRDSTSPPSIGRPVRGTRAYILDENRELVPAGVNGELYVGGAKLARGYLNLPALTAERFLPDPFDPSARVYRTGDLCRWNADGSIQYLGRLDHQVKLRGFRIELEEVEAVLGKQPGVRQCIAMVRGVEQDQKLIAYVVGDAEPDELRRQVAGLLPAYMVPVAIVTLDAMPLTANGKIDRAALPQPIISIASSSHQNPRNETERKLLEIWKELLGTDAIGIHDSFFDLGGHSLLGVRMVDRIRQAFRQNLPLAKLFTAPTIAELAFALGAGDGALSEDVLVPLRAAGKWAPLFCVPGIANDAFTFEPLTRRLDRCQPIYALLLQGLATRGGVPTTVEEMASAFLRHLRELQPKGPYRLGGYSFGGLIAHEMAAQLEDSGQQVELLAQFDGFAPSAARQKPLYQRLWLHARRAIEHGPHAAIQHYRDNVPLKYPASPTSGTHAAQLESTIRTACDLARTAHQSRRINARITLFRATIREDWREFLVHALDNGWGELTKGGLDIRDVDGGHLNLLQDQHVDRLAREFNACLHALENPLYKQACDPLVTQRVA